MGALQTAFQFVPNSLMLKKSRQVIFPILKKWMEFYISKLEPVATHLKTIYPRKPDEKESVYEKAIKARAFDSLRCFLPAGVTTQLAWHTNLRQAARKLALLNHHPDARIRELSQAIHSKLAERYASSFSHKSYEATEAYRASMAAEYTYFSPNDCPQDVVCKTSITPADIAPYMNAIKSRPAKTELPQFMLDLGLVTFEFQMDFGSFRDIQRHRNGVCRMPLLTTQFGFHPWYLDQLPTDIRAEAEALIAEQTQAISTLETSDINKQYYVGMGFRVPCRVSYGLPAALYTLELRSGKTVHPTLRRIAQQMAKTLQEKLPDLTIHADMDIDDWDVRRGLQDITHKPTV
jgi:thymidylate synthase ThyX